LLRVPVAGATGYYVSPAGDDAGPGTSPNTAWADLPGSVYRLRPGDTMTVLPGDYTGTIAVRASGDDGAPITLAGTEGARLTGELRLRNVQHVTVRGLEVVGTIAVEDCRHCVVEDCYVHDGKFVGVDLRCHWQKPRDDPASADCVVRNCRIVRAVKCGIRLMGHRHLVEGNDISHTLAEAPDGSYRDDADGIRAFGAGHIIRRNHIHDILHEPENRGDPHIDFLQTWGPAEDIVFEANTCYSPNRSGSNQIVMVEQMTPPVRDLMFRNNVFVMSDVNYSPMNFHEKRAGEIMQGIRVLNNMIVNVNPDLGGQAVRLTRCDNVEVQNNIVVGYAGHRHPYVSLDECGEALSIGHNCVWHADGSPLAGEAFEGDLWATDPRFVDPEARDYRLRADSPCIDAGTALGTVIEDLLGIARPQDAGWDMGAFERRAE
jgi:hypothetical protein